VPQPTVTACLFKIVYGSKTMNINLTSSISISAVVKERYKGKEEVIDRDEENSI